jgi:hypothetical protein
VEQVALSSHSKMGGYEAIRSKEALELAEEQHGHSNPLIYPAQLASDRLEAFATSSDISSDSGLDEVYRDIEKHSLLSSGDDRASVLGEEGRPKHTRSKV